MAEEQGVVDLNLRFLRRAATAIGCGSVGFLWLCLGLSEPQWSIPDPDYGFGGDGGVAISSSLFGPSAVAVDRFGNLFIADSSNYRIRKVDKANGIITTVAGTGPTGWHRWMGGTEGGYGGDGASAKQAKLNLPQSIAIDRNGNLFIADFLNHRVRRVDAITGTITTVAGTGTAGFSGDGGPSTNASLNLPSGIAVDDKGNVYIADQSNHRIRKLDIATGIINTVAGLGGSGGFGGDGGPATQAALYSPSSVAVDRKGNLFVADTVNYRIRKIELATGRITTVAGTGGYPTGRGAQGLATNIGLMPSSIVVDDDGNLFVSGMDTDRVWKLTIATGRIEVFTGTGALGGFAGDGGPAKSATLYGPKGLAVGGNRELYIADAANNRVRKVDLVTGMITTVAGKGKGGFRGDGGTAKASALHNPSGVTIDTDGNLLIADTANHRVRRIDTATGIITTVAGTGTSGFFGDRELATSANLNHPADVAVDDAGNLFIADQSNNRIRKVAGVTGVITTVAGVGTAGFSGDEGPAAAAHLNNPFGVAIDGKGNLFIADTGNHRVRRVDGKTGVITTIAPTGRKGFLECSSSGLCFPTRVAIEEGGAVFVADSGNHRVLRLSQDGAMTVVAGSRRESPWVSDRFDLERDAKKIALNEPSGIALDRNGNLYIADTGSARIRKVVLATGEIEKLAGSSTGPSFIISRGYRGDDGPAKEALLNSPIGIAISKEGILFVADRNNQRIRKISLGAGLISTIAGTGQTSYE